MKLFWIITKHKVVHLVFAASKEAAIDKHNDAHPKDGYDTILPAIKCDCGRHRLPILESWMEFTVPAYIANDKNICDHKGTSGWLPNEYGQVEFQQIPYAKDKI